MTPQLSVVGVLEYLDHTPGCTLSDLGVTVEEFEKGIESELNFLNSRAMGDASGYDLRNRQRFVELTERWRRGELGETPRATTQRQQHSEKVTELFGHSVAAIVRFMGSELWSKAEAQRALTKLGVTINPSALSYQLECGATGEGGDPAKLTRKQEVELYRAAK